MAYTGKIDKDLPHFALWVMAGLVTQDREVQDYLANKATVIYAHNKSWGKKIAAGDAPQRDLLINFMFHWFDGLIKSPEHTGRSEKLTQKFVAHVLKLAPTVPADRITGFGENCWPLRK